MGLGTCVELLFRQEQEVATAFGTSKLGSLELFHVGGLEYLIPVLGCLGLGFC